MSMPLQSTRKQLVIGQVSIIIFAFIAGYLGRNGWQYWLFVILYFIVFAVVMQKLGGTGVKGKVRVEEVESGKVILEEKGSFQILTEDVEYQKEMAEQMKLMQGQMLMFLPIMLYFILAFQPILNTVPKYFESEHLGYAVAYLVLFEGSFVLSRLGQWFMERRMKKTGKKMVMINAPRGFTVTDKGIILQGLASRSAIRFPLSDYKVVHSPQRNFVELVHETPKAVLKLRLYTRKHDRLYQLLKMRAAGEGGRPSSGKRGGGEKSG